MIKLALTSFRFRIAAFVATFLAVLLGSSLLIACGGLFESGLRLAAEPQRLAGAPLLVTGPDGFKLPDEKTETAPYAERPGIDLATVAKIQAIPGVATALPDLSFPAVVTGTGAGGGTVLSGHDWISAGLTPYILDAGAGPTSPGQVVLDAATARRTGTGAGARLDLVVGGAPRTFTVSGVAHSLNRVDAAAMFFSTADVQQFSTHPGAADVIGVFPAAGTSTEDLAARLASQLPAGTPILTGDDRGAAEFPGVTAATMPLILLSSIFGGMVMVVMALVVWATISLSVRQRQRELALLRATGATPKQVRDLVVAETMAVAVLATLGGLVLGRLVGGWVFELSSRQGVVPASLEFRQGPIPFAAGILFALVAPYLAARFAATAAGRTRPVQALAEASIPPVTVSPIRKVLAMVFAGATALMALTTMFLDPEGASSVGGPAVLTGSITVALLGPELVHAIVGWLTPVIQRFAPRNGRLAVINTRARAVQFAAVLTPITLATAIALGNVYSQTTQDQAALDTQIEQYRADAVISSDTGGIAPGLLDLVRSTPGVATASALVTSRGWLEEPYDGNGTDPLPLVGVDAQDQRPVMATPVSAGSLRDLTGDTVALPANLADDLGLAVGSVVTLRLGDATTAKTKVVALLDSPSDYGSIVVPSKLLAPHTDAGLPSRVLVRAAEGRDTAALLDTLRQRVRDFPGATAGTQDVLTADFAAGLGVQAWINYLLAALAMAYAAIASVNTLAVAVLSRRREFAVQRLAGATRQQVTRMLHVEAAVVAAAGLGLGTVIALFTVLPTAISAGVILPSGPVSVFLAVAVAVFAIVHPVTVLCARLAMKRRAIEAVAIP